MWSQRYWDRIRIVDGGGYGYGYGADRERAFDELSVFLLGMFLVAVVLHVCVFVGVGARIVACPSKPHITHAACIDIASYPDHRV